MGGTTESRAALEIIFKQDTPALAPLLPSEQLPSKLDIFHANLTHQYAIRRGITLQLFAAIIQQLDEKSFEPILSCSTEHMTQGNVLFKKRILLTLLNSNLDLSNSEYSSLNVLRRLVEITNADNDKICPAEREIAEQVLSSWLMQELSQHDLDNQQGTKAINCLTSLIEACSKTRKEIELKRLEYILDSSRRFCNILDAKSKNVQDKEGSSQAANSNLNC